MPTSSEGVDPERPAIVPPGTLTSSENPLGCSESAATTRGGLTIRAFAIELPGNASITTGLPPAEIVIVT